MLTGNKGEWSEIYALFKLLGDTILYPGDKNIIKLGNIFYPILKILRFENSREFIYSIEADIVIISENEEILRIPIHIFKEKALLLLNYIKLNNETTFSIPEIEVFMKSISCFSLKANSTNKTDITIVVHDPRTNHQPILGFSIKSQLGNPSTLLNAGKTTNFIYKISGINLSDSEIEEINNIDSKSKLKDRITKILDKGGAFHFIETEKRIFSNNLVLIDSYLPEILSHILFNFYTTNQSKIIDLITKLEIDNPMNFDISNQHKFYNYKTKRFLTDIALGMMPSIVWNGEYQATGGYLIIKEDGEVLCYHIYNKNEFENYLITNTKLETASSTRHEFGSVYKDEGVLKLKLNLQIRFIK